MESGVLAEALRAIVLGVPCDQLRPCKLEETNITIRTVERSLREAKRQLPEHVPGIIFVEIPLFWLDEIKFADEMRALADRFFARSPFIVSIKFYTVNIVRESDAFGETIGEVLAFDERSNPNHKFRRYKDRSWHMFPTNQSQAVRPRLNYNGMPASWQRLFVQTPDRI